MKRFPQHVRLLMWCSLAAYVIALVVASVAKETGVLIVFQVSQHSVHDEATSTEITGGSGRL